MLIRFFMALKGQRLPVSFTELSTLLECLKQGMAFGSIDEFYHLARLCLVKDERHFDGFDRAFARYFNELESGDGLLLAEIPDEWLRRQFEASLTAEEMARVKALGGLDKLLEEFRKRLEEQKGRHQGGSKWIGTGGTSPFGAYGYNPQGIRIGQSGGRQGSALKVWERRLYRDLDDSVELGVRNIKLALRRLRRFARSGAAEELDLDGTIASTARRAGLLDIRMAPERRNAVKVLIFFDVGGSMEPYVRLCEELFSAARAEFKHLRYYYFHNFLYESVWTKNRRRHSETIATYDILRKYGGDYRLIFVGDGSMAPYEITHAGGSLEHYNEEPGALWMQRLTGGFRRSVWINPIPERHWGSSHSIGLVQELLDGRMYPLSVKGLSEAMDELR